MVEDISDYERNIFDGLLKDCLVAIKGSKSPINETTKKAYHNEFEELATEFRAVVLGSHLSFEKVTLLQCANAMMQDMIAGRYNQENQNALLTLVESSDQIKEAELIASKAFQFVAVVALVASVVFAVPTAGLSLLGLIPTAAAAFASREHHHSSQAEAKKEEVVTSFASSGKSFFVPKSGEGSEKEADELKVSGGSKLDPTKGA
ncbi:MAG: hypothetical protein QNK11_07665 [Legionella sp.]|nr:hypothetical protein [Legionella sp.]